MPSTSNRAGTQEKPSQIADTSAAQEVLDCIPFNTPEIREVRESQALRSFADAVSASAEISAIKQFCAATGASICEPRITKTIGGESFILEVNQNDIFWCRKEAWTMPTPFKNMGHNRRNFTGADVLNIGVSSLVSSIEGLRHTIVGATRRLREKE
jgi:hypothetical protein